MEQTGLPAFPDEERNSMIERRKTSFFLGLISKATPASSMRWVFVFTFILLNTTLWSVWIGLSLAKMEMQNIPEGLGLAYAAALTIVTGGKIIQSATKEKSIDKEIREHQGE